MSDQVEEKSTQPAESKLTLLISLDLKTNNVEVTGPIHDQILALGMIESAKVALASNWMKSDANRIVKPNGILNFVRGKK